MPKPKVAIVSLTCCEGCEFAILDLPLKLLPLLDKIELKRWRLVDEENVSTKEKYDIAFIEGSAITKDNFETLKNLRKQSKCLIVLGNCAHMGGIHRMKNYGKKEEMIDYVYEKKKNINNPEIKPIEELVKVDFTLRGCPINGEEFVQACYDLLAGKTPKTYSRPVCYECQIKGYECVLMKGEACLGPLTIGGCEAICLKSAQACWGCRGPLRQVNKDSLVKKLLKDHSEAEIEKLAEVFGFKDDFRKLAKNS